MPEMSTYYYAWIQANQTQARGLIELYSGAVAMLITYGALRFVPSRVRDQARTVLHVFISCMLAALAVLLVRG